MASLKSFSVMGLPLLLFAACATAPQNINQQALSVQNPQALDVTDTNMATLTIARGDVDGPYSDARILVDGQDVGFVNHQQAVTIALAPGPRKIKLKLKDRRDGPTNSVNVMAQAGQSYTYKFVTTSQGGVGGTYGGLITTTYRLVPTTESFVDRCCELTAAP